jgi:cytochrome c553
LENGEGRSDRIRDHRNAMCARVQNTCRAGLQDFYDIQDDGYCRRSGTAKVSPYAADNSALHRTLPLGEGSRSRTERRPVAAASESGYLALALLGRTQPPMRRRAMRDLFVATGVLVLLCVVAAQEAPRRSGGNLAQVMRGIFFPNANLLFDVQARDPGVTPKKFGDVGASATETFSNIYSGWQTVENAAIALEEAADLLMKAGRLCENGHPVPVNRPDWPTFTQGMRDAARAAYAAAQARNRDQAIEVTNQIAEACANCHDVYRDKPDLQNRCIP